MDNNCKIFDVNYNHYLYVFTHTCNPSEKQKLHHQPEPEEQSSTAHVTSLRLVNKHDAHSSIHLTKPEFVYILRKLQNYLEININHPIRDVEDFADNYLLEDIEIKEIRSPITRSFPPAFRILAGSRQYILTSSDVYDLNKFESLCKDLMY